MKDFDVLPDQKLIQKTIKSLRKKGYNTLYVTNGAEAFAKIKELIPDHQTVIRGSSVTLEAIGFANYLKSAEHRWVDLHGLVHKENDPVKRAELRKKTAFADYYLGSVHALTKDGDFLIASNTGSQLPHITFTSPNLIFVISTKKIVINLPTAFERLEKYVFPLEDERMKKVYGIGSSLNKIIVFKGEAPKLMRKIHVILVEEKLGF